MRRFIARKMSVIFGDFERELSSLDRFCELKDIRFDGGNMPDYDKIQIQQLYLLRYFPAHLVEYYLIYKKVIILNFLADFKVFSLGCGANVDFYGLYYALQHHGTAAQTADFSYHGLDKTDWQYKEEWAVGNYNFCKTDINLWKRLDADDYNVIIFSKSIGEFSNKEFEHFQTILLNSNFTEDKLVLISSIRQQHSPTDMYRYEEIANLLTKNFGYNNLDNSQTYFHIRDAGKGFGLSNCCGDFYYPDKVKTFINNLLHQCPVFRKQQKPCEDDCVEALNKDPILTSSYMQFQINRFTRE